MLPDPVPARVHWPRFADLRVNSMSYRPYGRQANVKIGGNIRDEPANIGAPPLTILMSRNSSLHVCSCFRADRASMARVYWARQLNRFAADVSADQSPSASFAVYDSHPMQVRRETSIMPTGWHSNRI